MKALITLRYLLEAFALLILVGIFRLLPLDTASALGGKITQWLGPLTKAHRTGLKNLARIYPEMPEAERQAIVLQAWNNLGRVAGEFPYISSPGFAKRFHFVGLEHLEAARAKGKAILFYSAHYGNWEISTRAARELGAPITLIYRHANNPWVDKMIIRIRGEMFFAFHEKGVQGSREIMKAMESGTHLAMLVDQKMNDGISLPFMGQPAMTAPALARFSLKYGSPMVGCRVERVKGAYFRITFSPAIYTDPQEERHKAISDAMLSVNQEISRWIHESPGQWLWMHNRWPKA